MLPDCSEELKAQSQVTTRHEEEINRLRVLLESSPDVISLQVLYSCYLLLLLLILLFLLLIFLLLLLLLLLLLVLLLSVSNGIMFLGCPIVPYVHLFIQLDIVTDIS